MQLFIEKEKENFQTVVLRHRKENLKKCSLRGLETRSDFLFLTYPYGLLPDLSKHVLLTLDGPPLSEEDKSWGLFLIDGTWRYAEVMMKYVLSQQTLQKRSLPKGWKTAYPRRQWDCPSPEEGLASLEALYVAYRCQGREADFLLDHYYWKEKFLEINHVEI